MDNDGKIYEVNKWRAAGEIIFGFIFAIALIMLMYHYHRVIGYSFTILMTAFVVILIYFLIYYSVRGISHIELGAEKMEIKYLTGKKQTIPLSTLNDFSVTNYFLIELFFTDSYTSEKIKLQFFPKKERIRFCDDLAGIMEDKFMALSEAELVKQYSRSRYNFIKTEKHAPIFLFFISLSCIFPLLLIIVVLLDLFILRTEGGIYTGIEDWYYLTVFLPVLVYFVDYLIPRRTLKCENGILSLYKKDQLVKSINVDNIQYFSITYKSLGWATKGAPNKNNLIGLLGFSRSDRKEILQKVKQLWK